MINMVALSLAFPAIMGWQVSPAARWAQGALLAQTLGVWAAVICRARTVARLPTRRGRFARS
jgi:hypothetical protein